MKFQYSSLLIGLLLPLSYLNAEASLIPPNAKAGECYAKVVIPAKYKTVDKRVLIQEASNRISIIPAKYKWVDEKVEVTPISKKLKTIPAVYKRVTETIEVKPAERSWHTSLKHNSAPVSKEILVAAKLKGIALDKAVPNECFKEYFMPETYKTVSEEVVIQKERTKNEIVPAKYEMVEKTIEVTPATKKTLTIPATYSFTEEKVLVEKEKTVWKKGVNPAQKLNGATGEIMCLVKVPAKYKTVKKKIVKTPASTKIVDVPAVYKTMKIKKLVSETSNKSTIIPAVTKIIDKKVLNLPSQFSWTKVGNMVEKGWRYTGHRVCYLETSAQYKKITKTVLETPAKTQEIIIEPTYKVMKVKKLVQEAQEVKTPIPAVYKSLAKKEKVSDAYQSWERILCQTNMNKNVIFKIQKALTAKNYNAGKIDGVLGRDTRLALDKYQRDNSLATGGITYETLKALSVEL